ncbi:hypothetical protein [Clostridium oceanicum]|uniref:ABC-2 family transporter protein n=1 Tax=Clostridium oceanicum TaxID=1543 RepID=A0ABP3UQV4_9CLOT
MLKNILVISKNEFKSILKSWINIISIICLIIVPIGMDSPLKDGSPWIVSSAAYVYNHGLVSIAMMFLPLVVCTVYYKDQITKMPQIIFSQPVTPKVYALGKFLGVYLYSLFIGVIGNIVNLFIPLYFKRPLYTPIVFLKAFFIYSVPSLLFIVALCYFIDVFLNKKVFTIFIPFMFFLGTDHFFSNSSVSLRFRSEILGTLCSGKALIPDIRQYLLINRELLIAFSLVLVFLSVLKFSPKQLTNKR